MQVEEQVSYIYHIFNTFLLTKVHCRPGFLFNLLYRKKTLQEYGVVAIRLLTFVLKSYQSGHFKTCEDDIEGGDEREWSIQEEEEDSFHFDGAKEDLLDDEEEEETDVFNHVATSADEFMEFEEDDEGQDLYFDLKPLLGSSTKKRGNLLVDLSNGQIAACKEVLETLGLMKNSHTSSERLHAKLLASALDLLVAIFTMQPKGVHKGTEKSCIEPFLALICFNFEKGVFKSCKQMTPPFSRMMYLNQYSILKKLLQSSNPLK